MTGATALSDLAEVAALAGVFVGCLLLGTLTSPWRTVAIPAAVGVSLQFTGSAFNPLYLVLTFGPWGAGLALRSRRRLVGELAAVSEQLEAEEAHYAADQLRYERIRLARELHDTVAHWLTAMVVQAAAGQVVSNVDQVQAAETFGRIAGAAREAHADVERAVALVGDGKTSDNGGLRMIERFVAAAATTGMQVNLTTSGNDEVPIEVSATAARLVQEGLTNAMKYAPGTPVDITLRGHEHGLDVVVINGSAGEARSGLADLGSGLGLAGLRERFEARGGHLEAGPTPEGGWRLAGSLPD
jgi:signal transduction histidine kinase